MGTTNSLTFLLIYFIKVILQSNFMTYSGIVEYLWGTV